MTPAVKAKIRLALEIAKADVFSFFDHLSARGHFERAKRIDGDYAVIREALAILDAEPPAPGEGDVGKLAAQWCIGKFHPEHGGWQMPIAAFTAGYQAAQFRQPKDDWPTREEFEDSFHTASEGLDGPTDLASALWTYDLLSKRRGG